MQILNRSLKLSGTEQEDILVGINIAQGLILVIENRGPSSINVVDIGELEPNRFIIIGSAESVKIQSKGQFSTVDISAFLK
jgi:hypothetical protein